MSCRPSPPWPADQANVELKKMSDSRISPDTMSTVKEVDPSTRSRSGRLTKPMTFARSPDEGLNDTKPANSDESVTPGVPDQLANARPTASRNCGAVTGGRSRFVTKYRTGMVLKRSVTSRSPRRVPSFKYATTGVAHAIAIAAIITIAATGRSPAEAPQERRRIIERLLPP